MKRLVPVLFVGTILALTGCTKSEPGGPGAALPESEQDTIGQTDNSFSLDVPMTSTDITQSETDEVTIGIKRGADFDQDVALNFTNVPAGLTITPTAPSIGREDSETKLTLSAAADAAIGDFTIMIIGHPATGPDANAELKVSVNQK